MAEPKWHFFGISTKERKRKKRARSARPGRAAARVGAAGAGELRGGSERPFLSASFSILALTTYFDEVQYLRSPRNAIEPAASIQS